MIKLILFTPLRLLFLFIDRFLWRISTLFPKYQIIVWKKWMIPFDFLYTKWFGKHGRLISVHQYEHWPDWLI
jgi:hypothetical protein